MFTGVHNTTGSIAGVFSLMSMDKEFMKERDLRQRKKAGNVLEGVKQGAFSLFSGVTEGITGIISQPIKGASKDGASGFFKGIAKGVSGLITKPVAGVLDTISKTAEVYFG